MPKDITDSEHSAANRHGGQPARISLSRLRSSFHGYIAVAVRACSAMCAVLVAGPVAVDSAERKPNIVLILIDDMGWRDVGFMGNQFVETPHLDRLAAQGMVFTQAYASAPNCAPTRACLMSGQYTPRHGIYTVVDPRQPAGSPWHKLMGAESQSELATEVVTVAEALRDGGYATAFFGMWNLGRGRSGPRTPGGQGFGKVVFPENLGFAKDAYHDDRGNYLSDRLADEVLSFIDQQRERPFFVYLADHAVHAPYDPKPDLLAKYERKLRGAPAGNAPDPAPDSAPEPASESREGSAKPNVLEPGRRQDGGPGQRERSAQGPGQGQGRRGGRGAGGGGAVDDPACAATIEAVDRNVGRIMEALRKWKLEDSTLVVFTSDNGGTQQYTAPLRGGKGQLYEGGIRVPLAIRGPGVAKPGAKCEVPVASVDFFPTFLDLAGLTPPANQTLDGTSLAPLLRGASSINRTRMFWHFPCYVGRSPPSSALREGDYKLIEFFEDGGRVELYDLRKDPGERTDLSPTMKSKAASMHATLRAWQKDTGALNPPGPNPAYNPMAERDRNAPMGRPMNGKQGGPMNGKKGGPMGGKRGGDAE